MERARSQPSWYGMTAFCPYSQKNVFDYEFFGDNYVWDDDDTKSHTEH